MLSKTLGSVRASRDGYSCQTTAFLSKGRFIASLRKCRALFLTRILGGFDHFCINTSVLTPASTIAGLWKQATTKHSNACCIPQARSTMLRRKENWTCPSFGIPSLLQTWENKKKKSSSGNKLAVFLCFRHNCRRHWSQNEFWAHWQWLPHAAECAHPQREHAEQVLWGMYGIQITDSPIRLSSHSQRDDSDLPKFSTKVSLWGVCKSLKFYQG